MSDQALTITIDGQRVETKPGRTVLEVAREAGIRIPTLCWHPALKPVGVCRVCAVEVPERDGPAIRLACAHKVKDGMTIRTQSPLAVKARTEAFEKLLRLAPQSEHIVRLAKDFGIDLPPAPDGCIRCRLCTRVCHDVVGANALKMEMRDGLNYVTAREGACIGCGTCVNICPTQAIHLKDENGVRTIYIRDEIIGRHPLIRCESCGRMFATDKFLQQVADRSTDHHPDVKEHHRWCPTCAKLLSPRIKSFERPRKQ